MQRRRSARIRQSKQKKADAEKEQVEQQHVQQEQAESPATNLNDTLPLEAGETPPKRSKSMPASTTTSGAIKKGPGRQASSKKTPPKVKAAKSAPPTPKKADDEANKSPKKPKLKKHVSMGIPREVLARKSTPDPSQCAIKMISWNVNGLRALVRNYMDDIKAFVKEEQPDVICLQETKLQNMHVPEHEALLPGYTSYWSCSTAKKGYAGTAVFVKGHHPDIGKETPRTAPSEDSKGDEKDEVAVGEGDRGKEPLKKQASDTKARKKKPAGASLLSYLKKDKIESEEGNAFKVHSVTYGIGFPSHDREGRSVTVEFDGFFLVNLYVPNSGMKLDRLEYRVKSWNADLLTYLKKLEEKKPVVVTGDLNVAHLDEDIYNAGAKHVPKIAGCTPLEREGFSNFLGEGYVDTFRHQHGLKRGQFTYWSMRTGGRAQSKGLRLDYFVVSKSMVDDVSVPRAYDSYQLPDVQGSDHCPIGLIVLTK